MAQWPKPSVAHLSAISFTALALTAAAAGGLVAVSPHLAVAGLGAGCLAVLVLAVPSNAFVLGLLLVIFSFSNYVSSYFGWLLGSPTGALLRDGLLALVFLRWIVRKTLQPTRVPPSETRIVPLLVAAYLLLLLALVPLSHDLSSALRGLRSSGIYAFVMLFVADEIKSRLEAERVMHAIIAVGVVIGTIGILEFGTGGRFLELLGYSYYYGGGAGDSVVHEVAGLPRATGGIGNALEFGALMAMISVLAIQWGYRKGARFHNVLMLVAATICSAANVLSLTRSSLLGALIALGAVSVLCGRWRVLLMVAAAGGALAYYLWSIPWDNVMAQRFLFTGDIGSITALGRLDLWSQVLDTARTFPFGVGLGSRGAYWSTSAFVFDSYYAQILIESGVPGILLYGAILTTLAYLGFRLARLTHSIWVSDAGRGLLAVMLAVAVVNVLASSMESRILALYFWYLAGLILYLSKPPATI